MNKINLGSWNVKTLLIPGKMQELAEQITKIKMDIVAVQEIRWKGNGIINKKDYTFYYSGSSIKTGQAGTGFMVKKKILPDIIDFVPFNERLCKLRIKNRYNNITVLNIYAPTEEKAIEVKEQFYEDLHRIIEDVPKSDTLIVLGDFNAQLGTEDYFRNVTGKYTLHEITNVNGEMLCQLAVLNRLEVMSTQFQHKKIHKGTWISPDQNTLTQIDHVLINSSKKDLIEDVKTLRGPNIDSDHFLIRAVIKRSLPLKYKKKNIYMSKWNKNNMQNMSKLKEYKELLYNNLKELTEPEDINEDWKNLQMLITESAEKTIKKQEKPMRNEWWDEECRQIIREKNEARKKMLQRNTRSNQEHYKTKRKAANKLCKDKKRKWINDKLINIEGNYKNKEVRKWYENIKHFNQNQVILPTICRDEEGNILSQNELVLNRWKDYFINVFNSTLLVEPQPLVYRNGNEQQEIEPPTYNEVCHIINNLKVNKASGSDGISPELIRYGGRTLKQRLYKLISKIWDEERVPDQWNEGIIYPIFKRGDRLNCDNYRPIMLLNIAYKIFAIILNKRLMALTENKLDEYQMGFRPNRSTIDNIFTVRQIFEKCHEYKIDLHNIFVDFNKAFDSISRNKVIETLNYYEVPTKLIKLIASTLTNTTARIKINNTLSESFSMQSGVKQGDPLSATLFSLVIDFVLKQMDMRGNITTKLKQCIAYADDAMITARTKQALEETFTKLKKQSKTFGLIINGSKTKYLKCGNHNTNTSNLRINDIQIAQVNKFKYLGTTLNGNNSIEDEIKERIANGNRAYYANQSLIKSKFISKEAKIRIYKTIIRPVVTYACETWVLKDSTKQKLSIFERRILRKIFGPTKNSDDSWRIKTNKELNELINNQNIINFIRAMRLSWFGHVKRMEDHRLVKQIYKWKPIGTRAVGRPKNRWEDDVINDMRKLRISNWMGVIQNRGQWKRIVEKAKTFNFEVVEP